MNVNKNVNVFKAETREKGIAVFLDLPGRIRNTKLPLTKPLLPLFDAVVNAIDAIEETNRPDGRIEIHIIRDDSQLSLPDGGPNPITSFVVSDNGIGFTNKHYASFQTSDTSFKLQKGGKGVGRFLWLKAFEKVRIESIYRENSSCFVREFTFELSDEGVTNPSVKRISACDTGTKVTLLYLRPNYKKSCPQGVETIGKKLIQHCMNYFLWSECPSIILVDGDERISLNELFHEQISPASDHRSFSIKDQNFQSVHLRLYSSDELRHKVHYCANKREVYEENLATSIPDLQGRLMDKEGRQFYCATYVSGKLLDETVNNERTDFILNDAATGLFPEEITKKDLREGVMVEVKDFLRPYLETIEAKKMERIENFIHNQAPQYRPLLKYGKDCLRNIPADVFSDQNLDVELHRAKSRMVSDLKKRGEAFLKEDLKDLELERYKEQFREFADQLNDFAKSELAEYIIHRKLVLDFLQKSLELREDGKYHLEETVHQLIFPMRTTSDDIDYESQNLWVIDEKLSYHRYLASDLPLSSVEPVEIDSRDRPDLIIFNSPFAFVEDDLPFSSIVIIEFKKPLRDDYSDEDNPITQVYGYVKKVREGKAKDKRGRLISVTQSTPFYCYAICDLTEKLKEQAGNADLRPTPDGLGFFGYNKHHECYIEVISYDKVVGDAKKRNQILFDKLHLPRKY